MFKLFGSKSSGKDSDNLDVPLLNFGDYSWTIEDATKGTQIFGATGSGKSSGSGQAIAHAFLKKGFGGLVLCAKPDERRVWKDYAEATGRSDDLVFFSPKSNYRFDPIRYENERSEGGDQTINLVDLVTKLHQIGQNYSTGGGENEQFWQNALKRCAGRMIDLLKLAGESITALNLREILTSTLSEEEVKQHRFLVKTLNRPTASSEEKDEADQELLDMIEKSYCLRCLYEARDRTLSGKHTQNKSTETKDEIADKQRLAEETLSFVQNYFLREYAFISDKTKSIIQETFLGLIDPFTGGILKDHFSDGLSDEVKPEVTYLQGKIIILDFDIKNHMLAGVMAQGIYKYIWQRAMERREVAHEAHARPVFLWVDESQNFCLPEQDALFQTTARSSRVCTVYLTQNINNYYFVFGNSNPEARAKSLLGNLGTRIFHANSDFDTNTWAAETIGKGYHKQTSLNQGNSGTSTGTSDSYGYLVEPSEFTTLRTGGHRNKRKVEAYIVVNGEMLEQGKNYCKHVFSQNI